MKYIYIIPLALLAFVGIFQVVRAYSFGTPLGEIAPKVSVYKFFDIDSNASCFVAINASSTPAISCVN